jgi:hypothetical protein
MKCLRIPHSPLVKFIKALSGKSSNKAFFMGQDLFLLWGKNFLKYYNVSFAETSATNQTTT